MNHTSIRPRGFEALRTLDLVRLSQDFASDAGMIPKGTEGTVLQVFGDGAAYQIEFEGPYEVPETVPFAALKLMHAAP